MSLTDQTEPGRWGGGGGKGGSLLLLEGSSGGRFHTTSLCINNTRGMERDKCCQVLHYIEGVGFNARRRNTASVDHLDFRKST